MTHRRDGSRPVTEKTAERIAVALERLVEIMEQKTAEPDEPPVHLPRVLLDRGKPVKRVQ